MNISDAEKTVRQYYDRNTKVFAFVQGKKRSFAIHRRIWAPGVQTVYESTDFVHQALAQELEPCGAAVDLGCGVGESLARLDQIFEGAKSLSGITLSQAQAEKAALFLDPRIEIVTGSYLDHTAIPVPRNLGHPKSTLFYAIESLCHSPNAEAFVKSLSTRAGPGDRFAVCDDFIMDDLPVSQADASGGKAQKIRVSIQNAYKTGWLAPDLQSSGSIQSLFSSAGWKLIRDENWSPWVDRGGWIRRTLAHLFVHLSTRSSLGSALKGGAALDLGYGLSCFQYKFMVWEKQ